MRRLSVPCLAALAVAFAFTEAPALAQPICVPRAGGVPYNPEPPSWWAAGDEGTGPADARWRGAVALGKRRTLSTTRSTGTLRMLQRTVGGTPHLYLSMVAIDPNGSATGDRVTVALANADGSKRYALTVELDTQAEMATPDPARLTVTMEAGNEVGMSTITPPGWAQPVTAAQVVSGASPAPGRVRAWVDCGGDCSTGLTWTVQVQVPIGAADDSDLSAGLPLTDDFHVWLRSEAQFSNGPGTDTLVTTWPTVSVDPPAALTDWQPMRVGTAGSCRTGITLAPSHVQTEAQGGLEISANPTFHARPVNQLAGTLPGNAIRARFRIADWGSSPSDGAGWTDVCTGSGDAGTQVVGTDAGSGPASFDLSCSGTVDVCNYQLGATTPHPSCPPDSTTTAEHRPHQCILAELAVHDGAPEGVEILFTPDSVYRNMDVETASTVRREAVISLDGLGDLAGEPGREVYLYVETRNMPLASEVGRRGPPRADLDPRLARMIATGRVDYARVAERMPTYLVHVLHEDREQPEGGEPRKVFRLQPSFGFFVSHEGDFDHWLHAIEGEGVDKISDHLYRLGIDNGGQEVVTVHVQTCVGDECECEECAGCPEGGDCACTPPGCECQGPDCEEVPDCDQCACPDGGDCRCDPPECTCVGPDCPCEDGPVLCWLYDYWWVLLLILLLLVVLIVARRRSGS